MIAPITFNLTPEELLDTTRQLRHPLMRWNWIGNVGMTVFGILWLAVGVASLFLPPDPLLPRWKQLLMIAMGVFALAVFCVVPLMVARRRRQTRDGELRFSIDTHGIVMATPTDRVSRTWDQLMRVRRAVGGVLLEFVGATYWVPRRVFASTREYRDFITSLETVRPAP